MTLIKGRSRFHELAKKHILVLFLAMEYLPFFRWLVSKKNKSKFKTYLNGRKKFFSELDVVALLKSVRSSKILYQSQLHAGQKVLMQY